jgi:hypothetical protein
MTDDQHDAAVLDEAVEILTRRARKTGMVHQIFVRVLQNIATDIRAGKRP